MFIPEHPLNSDKNRCDMSTDKGLFEYHSDICESGHWRPRKILVRPTPGVENHPRRSMMVFFKISFQGCLLLAIASTFLQISVQAEEIPARGPIPFVAFDMDGNGHITEQEFAATREKRMAALAAEGMPMGGATRAPEFSDFDTNGDGYLTPDELVAGQQAQMEKRSGMGRNMPAFSDFDLNGDGIILEEEFNETRSKRITERTQQGYQMRNLDSAPSFADIDTNSDGEIDPDEFAAHQAERRQQRTR